MGRNKLNRLPMDRVLQLQGILRHGDVTNLAKKSKLNKAIVSEVLRGKRAVTNYPALASNLREFINKRKQELLYENGYLEDLDSLYSEVKIQPKTKEEFDFKYLTYVKVSRMTRDELRKLIEFKGLDIDKTDIREMDLEDLAEEVCSELNLKS
jgi:hypothetical protein